MKKRNLVLFGTVATLSLALAGSIGTVVASAEKSITNASPSGQTTTVTCAVEEGWTVTIPERITIVAESKESAGSDQVKIAAGAILGEGKTSLKVTVSIDGDKFELKAGENSIEYELRVSADNGNFAGQALTSGGLVASTEGGNAEDVIQYLQAKIKEDAAIKVAGTYTGTLTFNVTQE